MTVICLAIVCDGTSDLCLECMTQWVADTAYPNQAFRIIAAREVIPNHGNLSERLRRTHKNYPSDIIICHRDAEAATMDQRIQEIAGAAANIPIPVVPAVPIRMIESWLLTDQQAIRRAADNKNGQAPLNLPLVNRIEKINDAKSTLFAALRAASSLPPQRLRNFNEGRARSRVASFIEDFSQLRALPSFLSFERQLIAAIALQQPVV